ncbi:MAG: glutathione binding-like protein, partial [Geminicoccaceae bacterium]
QTMDRFLDYLDAHLAGSAFLAGDNFSIADITAFIAVDFSKRANYEVAAKLTHVLRWDEDIRSRPSTDA